MEDLSLFILDITQNSISANSSLIKIKLYEDGTTLTLVIEDDGKGIEPSILLKVADPFYTTRTTRKVGMGLSLLKAAAEGCGGDFEIKSQLGKGTVVQTSFKLDHIDCPPLGKMDETLTTLIICNPDIDFVYEHS